jgi:hypothetical protein
MNYSCAICGAGSDSTRCPEHRAKWQRRFFYPCKYCGGHVKSYKAKRCRKPECFRKAMQEAAARRFQVKPRPKAQKVYTEVLNGRTFVATATAWARLLGKPQNLISYHLSRGKSIAEIIARFTKQGGKHAR